MKILTLAIQFLNLILLVHLQTTPEDRCTDDGSTVCLDCFRFGTCVSNGDGTFSIGEITPCPTAVVTYCDDSLYSSGSYGQCSPVPASTTTCSCSSINSCVADPNNPSAILHCESDPPTTDDCSSPVIDLTTCSCLTCSDSCPLVDDPTDACASYYVCAGTEFTQIECLDNLCFDEASCGCVDSGGLSTEQFVSATDTIITGPSTPATCPSGCPFLDDPGDDCGSYFVCSGTELIPITCTGTLCFDQTLCGCQDTGGLSTESPTIVTEPTANPPTIVSKLTTIPPNPTIVTKSTANPLTIVSKLTTIPPTATTSTTCPPGCPFLDDPDDDCGSYFVCSGTELLPIACIGTLCFDQTLCGCQDTGSLSTESPTIVTEPITNPPTLVSEPTTNPSTLTTCPPGCPFVDDPDDNCGSYFVCSGTELTPIECLGSLCFDQTLCGCVDNGGLSTEPPTIITGPITNPQTKVSGPTTKFPTILTELTTIPGTQTTCPPGCPFLDDPDDDCASYFICSGTELTPIECLGSLCFDQTLCGCIDNGGLSTEAPTIVTEPITKPPTIFTEPTTIPGTQTTCPPGCPFLDDPDDDCASYFVCSGTELIPISCTGTLCFDQTVCGCIDSGGLSTKPLTIVTKPITIVTKPITIVTEPVTKPSTPTTCPPGCPFLDDPDDDCGSYFVCTGTDLFPIKCVGTLCFDQTACSCTERGVSSTVPPTKVTQPITLSTIPPTPTTCPPGCPFVDDPYDNCKKFYICDEGSVIAAQCPGILCFDQAECQCN